MHLLSMLQISGRMITTASTIGQQYVHAWLRLVRGIESRLDRLVCRKCIGAFMLRFRDGGIDHQE